MKEKILIVFLIHIIGAIVTIIIHYKNGTFEYAAKHGDGIRFANPSDVIFQDLFLWEFNLLIFVFFSIDGFINYIFDKKYNNADWTHVQFEKGEIIWIKKILHY